MPKILIRDTLSLSVLLWDSTKINPDHYTIYKFPAFNDSWRFIKISICLQTKNTSLDLVHHGPRHLQGTNKWVLPLKKKLGPTAMSLGSIVNWVHLRISLYRHHPSLSLSSYSIIEPIEVAIKASLEREIIYSNPKKKINSMVEGCMLSEHSPSTIIKEIIYPR